MWHPNPRDGLARGLCMNWKQELRFKDLITLFKVSFQNWNKHNATRLGAALAFYTIVSISPLVVLAVAIVSFAFSKSTAQGHLLDEVQSLVGYQGRVSVENLLEHGQKLSSGLIASIAGVVMLVLGASGVFQELRSDLNEIWDISPQATSGWRAMLRERVFSFGLVLSVGFVLMVSLLVSTALAAVSKFVSQVLPLPPFVFEILNFVISLAGIAALFAAIFRYVPACRVEWRDVRVGATVTAVMFVIGKTLLGIYLGMSTTASSYGAAGSLVVLVVWVYYSAQIFYLGAEFTHAHALANRNQLEKPREQAAFDPKAAWERRAIFRGRTG
jgi:membrane protein